MTKNPFPLLNVSFMGCSKDTIEILYSASKISLTSMDPRELWAKIRRNEISREAMTDFVSEKFGDNCHAPLRQAQFIFVVDNISRLSASKLNRQQMEMGKTDLFRLSVNRQDSAPVAATPPSFRDNPDLLEKWNGLQAEMVEFYHACREHGIDPDDAGFALPQGLLCREQISMNFQTIQRFMDQGLCENTQWEIREMSWQILQILKVEFPTLAKRLGIKCWENRNLACDEPYHIYQSCKWNQDRPHKKDLTGIWKMKPFRTAQKKAM
ncbi:FAD-dependent thymidylate synthase [bacterium]|nr:FAD-dependent thymidylate synthase [bacterium]